MIFFIGVIILVMLLIMLSAYMTVVPFGNMRHWIEIRRLILREPENWETTYNRRLNGLYLGERIIHWNEMNDFQKGDLHKKLLRLHTQGEILTAKRAHHQKLLKEALRDEL